MKDKRRKKIKVGGGRDAIRGKIGESRSEENVSSKRGRSETRKGKLKETSETADEK